MKSFDELARFHGLSLIKWDEDNYASENTQLAKDFFEAGQQSKQAEVDELQKRIDEALHEADESCGVSVDAFVKLNRILKGDLHEH